MSQSLWFSDFLTPYAAYFINISAVMYVSVGLVVAMHATVYILACLVQFGSMCLYFASSPGRFIPGT